MSGQWRANRAVAGDSSKQRLFDSSNALSRAEQRWAVWTLDSGLTITSAAVNKTALARPSNRDPAFPTRN